MFSLLADCISIGEKGTRKFSLGLNTDRKDHA